MGSFLKHGSLLSFALLAIGLLGSKFGLFHFTTGFLFLLVSIFAALAILITVIVYVVQGKHAGKRREINQAAILVAPQLLMLLSIGASAGKPMIHNISTDTVNPPQFVAAAAQRGEESNPLDYSEEVASQQREGYPDLKGLSLNVDRATAYAKALAAIQTLGWEIYHEDPVAGQIEAVDTSFLFNFKDDVVVRLTVDGDSTIIDVRSVSRVGKGDLGANAKRIRKLLETIENS